MATIVSSNGALSTSDVNIDTTAATRYLRCRFVNTNTTTERTVTVKVGTRVADKFTLKVAGTEGSVREFGPVSVPSGTNLVAAQDVGTDTNYFVTGEY